jgi:hypothetical protein
VSRPFGLPAHKPQPYPYAAALARPYSEMAEGREPKKPGPPLRITLQGAPSKAYDFNPSTNPTDSAPGGKAPNREHAGIAA